MGDTFSPIPTILVFKSFYILAEIPAVSLINFSRPISTKLISDPESKIARAETPCTDTTIDIGLTACEQIDFIWMEDVKRD